MKLRATDGQQAFTFDLQEDNLWLDVLDDSGEPRFAGSLWVVRDGEGIRIELGTPENDGQMWEPQNPIHVANEALRPTLIITEGVSA
jgi:hypothetical protein